MTYAIANTKTGKTYERISSAGKLSEREHRWIGRCTACGRTHKLEGRVMLGHPGVHGGSDYVVQTPDGRIYYTQTPSAVKVPCTSPHWCTVKMVFEGAKASKHTCGAKCTNATGPSCDCRCKGANHGSNC